MELEPAVVEYRRSAHAVTDLKYHVIWVTKYRYKILRGDIAERARELLRQICVAREVTIIRGAVSLRRHAITVIVEEKQRVVADRLEVPVVGTAFLLPMHRRISTPE